MATSYTTRLGSAPEEGVKAPCLVSTSAGNITLSGEQTIDGVAVVAGDRVLVMNQTTGTEDGIYIARVGSWERAPDWNRDDDIVSGMLVVVSSGDAYDNTYKVTFDGDHVLDTTEYTFTYGEAIGEVNLGAALAGDGVNVFDAKVGVTLNFRNIAPASAKITVTENGDDIDLDVDPAEVNYITSANATDLTDGGETSLHTHPASGTVDTSGTPVANDFAKFTDADTIEGRSYAEVKADLDLEIGTDVLAQQTVGIANNNLVEVDDADAADNDFAKFTASGLEGRSYAEVKADLGLEIGTDVLAEQTVGIADDNLVEVDDADAADNDFAKFTANGLEGRSYAEVKADLSLNLVDNTSDDTKNAAAVTLTNKTIDCDNNTVTNVGIAEFDPNVANSWGILYGMALDTVALDVTSNGTVITASMEKDGGGEVTLIFSTGFYQWDTDPAATISLTAGTDTTPEENFIYVLESDKTLYAVTTGWPATEHHRIGTVVCQSAASVQTDGCYKVHAWSDHVANSTGHIAHTNAWIRYQCASWLSGAALTPTVGAATFDIAVASAVVMQLHEHAFPAFDTSTGSVVYIVNHPDTAYRRATDLTQTFVDKDSAGVTLGGSSTDFYNLVIWGVVSEDTGDCQLMCNLPSAAYGNNNGDQASIDVDATAIYTLPTIYRGTGFLIARLTVQESGGTYSIIQNTDLRGLEPAHSAGGGSSAAGNEFQDSLFQIQDTDDITRVIDFDAGSITTGNARTITMPDTDVDLGDLAGATLNADADVSGNTWVLDEDAMGSDSATKCATQQSIKKYVDDNIAAGGMTSFLVGGDSGSDMTVTNGEEINIAGGTGIDTTVATGTPEQVTVALATAGVALSHMADMATASFLGRDTAGSGVPEVLSVAEAITLLALDSADISDFAAAVASNETSHATVLVDADIGGSVLAQQTIGIANNNLVEVDDADAAATDFARFTASGLEGRSYAEVRSDLGLVIGTNVLAEQTIGIANDNLLEVDHVGALDGDFAKFTANGIEGRGPNEMRADLDLEVGVDFEAVDADIARVDVDRAWTAPQRAVTRTADDNNATMAMNSYQDFQWTSDGASDVLAFSGETIGYRGMIILTNGSNHTITAGAEVKIDAATLTAISVTGIYMLSYWCYDGTNVAVTASVDLT